MRKLKSLFLIRCVFQCELIDLAGRAHRNEVGKLSHGKGIYDDYRFSILPVIVVYLILSKHIVGGVAIGSVKG